MLMLFAAGCSDDDGPTEIEATVFLPDGYYRESSVRVDSYLPCKGAFTCQTPGGINFCTKSGLWEPGPGHCGSTMSCGRCVHLDYGLADGP